MSFRTFGTLKEQVKNELDLQDETQISDAEFLDFCNEAIEEAESEIHKLCEDYFKSKASLTVTSGQASYQLPTYIYADKIRKIVYWDGSKAYEVKRLKSENFATEIPALDLDTGGDLTYDILNNPSVSGGPRIVFHPAPDFSDSTTLTIWYIRNAAQVAADGDTVDIPEFSRFIKQYMKVLCCEREGHPLLEYHMQKAERYRQKMIESLSDRTPDGDNEIEQDLSVYEEHT
jgi:hypothetical protein